MRRPLEWVWNATLWLGLSLMFVVFAWQTLGSRGLSLAGVASALLATTTLAAAIVWFLLALVRFVLHRWRLRGAIVMVLIVVAAASALALLRGPATAASPSIAVALAATEVGEWDLALAHLLEAQRREPGSREVLRLLGLVSANAGGRDLIALAWLRAYLASEPRAADAERVRREIRALERRARESLEDVIQMLRVDADGTSGPARAEAQAAINAARKLATAAASARADQAAGEPAAWVTLINERLLGRPAIADLGTALRSAKTAEREARVRLLATAARDLATGLGEVRATEAAWRAARR